MKWIVSLLKNYNQFHAISLKWYTVKEIIMVIRPYWVAMVWFIHNGNELFFLNARLKIGLLWYGVSCPSVCPSVNSLHTNLKSTCRNHFIFLNTRHIETYLRTLWKNSIATHWISAQWPNNLFPHFEPSWWHFQVKVYGSAEGPPLGVENRKLLSHPDDLRMEAYVIRIT